ncbi:MAG: glycosyltransferase [Candidatus Micrarchaeia archaeon]
MSGSSYALRVTIFVFVVAVSALSVGISVYFISMSYNLYMLVVSLLFLILSLIASIFNIIAAFWYYNSYFYKSKYTYAASRNKRLDYYPTVAIAVPTYNEPASEVISTMEKAKRIKYPRNRINFYLLDDSTNEEIASKLSKYASESGVNYIHRDNRKGFKAGALNNLLRQSSEEFIAIFDADEYLTNRNFLIELLPIFKDRDIAYVQTEKRYAKNNLFSNAVDMMFAFFFKFAQTSRAMRDTANFAGSCAIVRKDALLKIGGFPEHVLEDTFLSFEMKNNNFKGVYIHKNYALGRPMNKFIAFARQQWRYNYGGTEFLYHYLKTKKEYKANTMSKLDYISHGFGLNYISIILILFTILSVLITFGGFPFAHASVSQLLSANYINEFFELGLLTTLVIFIAPLLLSKIYFNSFKSGIMVYILNFSVAFIRAKAAVQATLGLKPKNLWAKGNLGTRRGAFLFALKNSVAEVSFSTVLFAFSVFAIANSNFSGGIWLLWYSLLYGSTFVFFYKYR